MGRVGFWCFVFLFFLTSCAHINPASRASVHQRTVSQHISQSFIRIQVVRSYEILACQERNTDLCRVIVQMSKATSFGSAGIIDHTDNSTSILTAAHVVDDFGQMSPVTPKATEGFLIEFGHAYGISPEELRFRLKASHLKIKGLKTVIYAIASDGNSYEVENTRCSPSSEIDACIVTTKKIKGTTPIPIASSSPEVGDKVMIASGPFGYAIPGMMVPLFEGIYSGQTPDSKDYYTLQVVPGSSGSLIVNSQGEVVGIVSMFITGSFCPGRLRCQVLPSGVMVSVPLKNIRELVYLK